MEPLLTLKPSRRNYLLFLAGFVFTLITMTSLVSIFLFGDVLRGISVTSGSTIGLLLGGLLLWVYDEIKMFERWTVTLTENALILPKLSPTRKVYLLAGLDRSRTTVYNSEKNLRNRIRYTFWLVNGETFMIGKLFYGRSKINTLLEKIGLPEV